MVIQQEKVDWEAVVGTCYSKAWPTSIKHNYTHVAKHKWDPFSDPKFKSRLDVDHTEI